MSKDPYITPASFPRRSFDHPPRDGFASMSAGALGRCVASQNVGRQLHDGWRLGRRDIDSALRPAHGMSIEFPEAEVRHGHSLGMKFHESPHMLSILGLERHIFSMLKCVLRILATPQQNSSL